jgi:hypothetical protein
MEQSAGIDGARIIYGVIRVRALREASAMYREAAFERTPHLHLVQLSILAIVLGLAGCGNETTAPAAPKSPGADRSAAARKPAAEAQERSPALAQPQGDPGPFRFTDILEGSGVDFVHVSGMTKERHFPTANGSGVAIFNYDNDGLMDLYFASFNDMTPGAEPVGRNRLYRNLGDGKFADVTDASGLGFRGLCHGIIAADLDNDGDTDVFLGTHCQNTLYLNQGNGAFRDVSREAGIAPPAFRGRLLSGETDGATVFIDAMPGLLWRVGDGEPSENLEVNVRAGQRIVFRQADPTAARGVDLLIDGANLQRVGEKAKPEAWLKEVGENATRIARAAPPLAAGSQPVVMAEFEVVRDLPSPVAFRCSENRPAWSSGGACLDFDQDGDLDMYVTNYGWWTVEQHGSTFCGHHDPKNPEKDVRQYCSPKEVKTVKHLLYRNDGVKDGIPRFTNVYDDVIFDHKGNKTPRADGHGFGVVVADVNGDKRADIYVANDQNPAFLFLSMEDGTLRDVTEECGAAYDEKGATQSGMGVDAEDVDGDGLPELFRTNFAQEYNTLYQNLGKATFYDQTPAFGLAADAMPWVGWGCALADFDNDGWPDAFVTNGHVDDNYEELGNKNTPYEEPPLLHRNTGPGKSPGSSRRFKRATVGAGPYFDSSHVGRGAAFGDLDNDGDIDIVINHKGGPPAILRNDTPTENRWIRLNLIGRKGNRDAVGTQIEVVLNDLTIKRQRKSGGSMLSTNDPRVLIGLGAHERIESLIIHWPSGAVTTEKDLETNKDYKFEEPEITPIAARPAPAEGQEAGSP